MEKGAAMLRRILLIAFLMGVLVILFNPDYRDTARALWRGEIEESAIWDSNRAYYSEVAYELEEFHEATE